METREGEVERGSECGLVEDVTAAVAGESEVRGRLEKEGGGRDRDYTSRPHPHAKEDLGAFT